MSKAWSMIEIDIIYRKGGDIREHRGVMLLCVELGLIAWIVILIGNNLHNGWEVGIWYYY